MNPFLRHHNQVDAACDSLNEGDVFVLDAGKNIFVWVGKEAGLVKQSKGLEIANMINSENKGMCEEQPVRCSFILGRLESSPTADLRLIPSSGMGEVSILLGPHRDNNMLFWEIMGGKGQIAPAEEAMTDKEVAEEMADSVFLYKCASALPPVLCRD